MTLSWGVITDIYLLCNLSFRICIAFGRRTELNTMITFLNSNLENKIWHRGFVVVYSESNRVGILWKRLYIRESPSVSLPTQDIARGNTFSTMPANSSTLFSPPEKWYLRIFWRATSTLLLFRFNIKEDKRSVGSLSSGLWPGSHLSSSCCSVFTLWRVWFEL